MGPSDRQVDPSYKLLHLLVLWSGASIIAAVVASLPKLNNIHGGDAPAEESLIELVAGPLGNHNLLLITDDQSQGIVDLSRIGATAEDSSAALLITSQHSFLHTHHPRHHTQGTHVTVLMVFYQDPSEFLRHAAEETQWNPSYIILFCLNPNLNTTGVISHSVIQRSQFIFLMRSVIHSGRPTVFAYTSLPTMTSNKGRSLIQASMGLWDLKKFQTYKSIFPPRFDNFDNQVLDVSMVCYDEPFLYYNKKGECVGSNLDALRIIGKKLNFQITLSSPDEIVFGYLENGVWTGMLGQLMYEGKQISVNVLQPSPERARDFDFTYPYWDDGFAFMLSVPPPVPQWKNILYPFSTLMWGLIALTTIAVPTGLSLLLKYLGYIVDPIGFILKVSGGLVNQPMSEVGARGRWWARLWLVGWWVGVYLMGAAYMSNLVAVLTVPVYPTRINTLKDLADSDIIPAMLDYGDFVPQALKTSKNPTLAALGARLYLDPDVSGNDLYGRLVQKVLGGQHALTITVDYLIFLQHDKNLTALTYLMDEEMYKGYMSWFLPLYTPYTATISHHLQRLLETGVMDKLYKTHQGSLTREKGKVRGDGRLSLDHLQGAFIILGLGMLLATITAIVERII